MAFGIPKFDVRKFHLFVALMLDLIWRCRNLLIHKGVQPSPIKAIHQISYSFKFHLAAWNDLALPVLWLPPAAGWVKGNFDVAVKDSYAVAAVMISNDRGDIVGATTQKLQCIEALQGEALAALLASRLAASLGYKLIALEEDALLVVLAINGHSLFSSWNFSNCIADISLVLSSFQSKNILKVSRSANFRTHALKNGPLLILFLKAFSQDLLFSLSSKSEMEKILHGNPFLIQLENIYINYSPRA